MLTKIQHILATFLLLIATTVGHASEGDFYFGLGVGKSQLQLNEPTLVNDYILQADSQFTDSTTVFSLYGGYQLDEYMSLEMDFTTGGDVTATSGTQSYKLFTTDSLAFTAMVSAKISDNISAFGRLGAVFWSISEGSMENAVTINDSTDLTYGFGVDINLYGSAERQFRIQWNRYEYDGVYIKNSDTFTGSLLFLFDMH